jgi:transposase
LDNALTYAALEHMLTHLAGLDAQLAALDHQLEQIATREPWSDPVAWLCSFRGISTRTALGLLAEIGDFHRFGHPRELMSYLGLTPSEYSSGEQQHRGHITKTGNRHARRLLLEAAWHHRHRPRQPTRAARLSEHVPPEVATRAWQAQIRLHHRHRVLAEHAKRSTVANVAIARELTGFTWGRWGVWAVARRAKRLEIFADEVQALEARIPDGGAAQFPWQRAGYRTLLLCAGASVMWPYSS